jgi:hypothetical protein
VTIYHDRLAVTRLADGSGQDRTEPDQPMTHTQRGLASDTPITAITSEGVATADGPVSGVDTEESTDREHVAEGEVGGVAAGTSIEELNTGQLRALAKSRGIRLGVRKDKREAMLQALRDGA